MDNARRLVALQLALHAFRRTVRVQLQRHQRVTLACCHEAACRLGLPHHSATAEDSVAADVVAFCRLV